MRVVIPAHVRAVHPELPSQALALSKKEFETAMQENESGPLSALVEGFVVERAELKVRIKSLQTLTAQLDASRAATDAMRDARDQAREEASLVRGQIQARWSGRSLSWCSLPRQDCQIAPAEERPRR